MLYVTVATHPLRSGEVQKMEEPVLGAQITLAESLLGLPEVAWTGRAAILAATAIVLQVNWQVEYNTDPFVLAAKNAPVSRTSTKYKDEIPLVDPRARQLVDEALGTLPSGRYGEGVRSLRGPQT